MTRTRSKHLRSGLAGAALALLLVVAAALPAAATYVPKTFTMAVTPSPVTAGANAAFSAKFTNKSNITLGAINLNVPPLLTITGVSTPKGTWTAAGNNVQLRSLALGAGKSFTVVVSTIAPCAPANLTWYVMATSGADFSGTTFALDTANSKRTTKVNGTCHLAFVAGSQPTGANPGAAITDTPFETSGGPVGVRVLDGANNPSPFAATIAMAIGVNPGGGSLGGTTSQATSAGVASFAGLTIDEPGLGYRLVASSTGLGIATSDPFNIAGLEVSCADPEADCVGTLSNDTTTATVNAKADNESVTDLIMTLLDDDLDCDGYDETSSTVDFNVTSSTRYKEVTIRIDSGMISIEGSDPAAGFEICYSSPNPFTDKFENTGVTLGLLPDCDSEFPVTTAPCVLSRVTEGAGPFVDITFLAPGGDPRGRV